MSDIHIKLRIKVNMSLPVAAPVSPGIMNALTIHLSNKRDSIGVMEMGLQSLGSVGCAIFGRGLTHAFLHCCGTIPVLTD